MAIDSYLFSAIKMVMISFSKPTWFRRTGKRNKLVKKVWHQAKDIFTNIMWTSMKRKWKLGKNWIVVSSEGYLHKYHVNAYALL